MKTTFRLLFVGMFLSMIFASCSKDATQVSTDQKDRVVTPQSLEGNIIPNQYIVQLKPEVISSARDRFIYEEGMTREKKGRMMEALNAEVEKEVRDWLERNNVSTEGLLHVYATTFAGFAINISGEKYKELQRKGDIMEIEADRMDEIPQYQIESIDNTDSGNRAQTTPCGITNAGGSTTGNASRWIWIIDSGIDLDHPDLQVVTSTTYAKSFVGGTANDCNGHGTHVAGTAAARNNTIGVVGVAAGAKVVPVRVFGCSGGSPSSTIINGINHVATYDLAGDVANMSLGGYYGTSGCSTSSTYKTSVNSLAAVTRVAIASGNNNSLASRYQPGCLNGSKIYTVTNMRCNKTYYNDATYGGNYGSPPVDWIATGTSVYSTYLNGGYATLTGTSMATPHVAGIMQVRNAGPLQNGTVTYSGVNYKIAKR